ncbi:group III truncated hemoglobin [uncultured Roseobacter sp.]|uniref:group III truncated hemoglobin n=1 Tax=uncultured Roseobacter sp. TaxID=114847 RepID=UPI00260CC5AB|nr:group III truncated hemoglobin [uncultured Roseobacter sp.]
MGLTPEAISEIVEVFYVRIRAHPILAPVFNDSIGDNWRPHLTKMKSFWLSFALNAGTYAGKPNEAHKTLTGVTSAHFGIWMGLFRQTVRDVTGSEDATAYLETRAQRMAASFKKAMGLEAHRAAK